LRRHDLRRTDVIRKRSVAAVGLATAVVLVPLASAPAWADGGGTLTVSPSVVVETDDGGISLVVEGSGLPPLMGYTLYSDDMATACTGGDGLDGLEVAADYDGNFNTVATGFGCIPGNYCIEAAETMSPYETVENCFTVILPPLPTDPVGPPIGPPPGPPPPTGSIAPTPIAPAI
jgi:hypothetical protein